MKKKFLKTTFFTTIALFSLTALSYAGPITVNYTGDNVISDLYYFEDGVSSGSLALGANFDNWQRADSYQIATNYGSTYEFVWEVQNDGDFASGNPAGLLATITTDAQTISTSSAWQYSADFGKNWSNSSTEWSPNNITGTPWSPVNGIATDAQWIWSDLNFANGDHDTLLFKTSVATPAPEPATMLLFGAGLASLTGIVRRKTAKRQS